MQWLLLLLVAFGPAAHKRKLDAKAVKTVVEGRILEMGAELIGLNHPVCIAAADLLGFALSVVTPEDDYAGAWLESPLILDGVSYDPQAVQPGRNCAQLPVSKLSDLKDIGNKESTVCL